VSATGIKLDQTPRQIEELGHAVQRAASSVTALVSDDGRTGVMM
jgi:hypothetical protein